MTIKSWLKHAKMKSRLEAKLAEMYMTFLVISCQSWGVTIVDWTMEGSALGKIKIYLKLE